MKKKQFTFEYPYPSRDVLMKCDDGLFCGSDLAFEVCRAPRRRDQGDRVCRNKIGFCSQRKFWVSCKSFMVMLYRRCSIKTVVFLVTQMESVEVKCDQGWPRREKGG